MTQVMKYGFPHADWLLCENPVCEEKATFRAHEVDKPKKLSDDGRGTDKSEVFGCTDHISQLTESRASMRLEKLRIPGERNK